jgi:hypothetical protein
MGPACFSALYLARNLAGSGSRNHSACSAKSLALGMISHYQGHTMATGEQLASQPAFSYSDFSSATLRRSSFRSDKQRCAEAAISTAMTEPVACQGHELHSTRRSTIFPSETQSTSCRTLTTAPAIQSESHFNPLDGQTIAARKNGTARILGKRVRRAGKLASFHSRGPVGTGSLTNDCGNSSI